MGYEKGDDGKPFINEKEAAVVRLTYRLYLDGKTPAGICHNWKRREYPRHLANSILHNEEYKGDALLQKKFTVDFLTKKMKPNEGEVQQYYVEGSHTAIICPEKFDRIQDEIVHRKTLGRHYSGNSVFSPKLVCTDYGGYYGPKVWHSTDKYRRAIWRCNAKFDDKLKCATPHLTEDEIKAMFLKAYNQLMDNREQVISDCMLLLELLTDCSKLDAELGKAKEEIVLVSKLVTTCIQENATKALSQEAYNDRCDGLVKRYTKAIAKLEKLNSKKTDQENREHRLLNFIDSLRNSPLVPGAWDEQLWTLLVIKGTVQKDGSIESIFKYGEKS